MRNKGINNKKGNIRGGGGVMSELTNIYNGTQW